MKQMLLFFYKKAKGENKKVKGLARWWEAVGPGFNLEKSVFQMLLYPQAEEHIGLRV